MSHCSPGYSLSHDNSPASAFCATMPGISYSSFRQNIFYLLCVCTRVSACVRKHVHTYTRTHTHLYQTNHRPTMHVWRSKDNLQKSVFSTMWVLGIEFKSSVLVASVMVKNDAVPCGAQWPGGASQSHRRPLWVLGG